MASSVSSPGSGRHPDISGLPAHYFDKAGSLQRLLELETQFKLARLGIGRAESTPDLKTTQQDLTSELDPRNLRDRRRDLGSSQEGEADGSMLSSIRRRSVNGPPLSIDIIPRNQDGPKSRRNGSKTVSFAAPDEDNESDRSSICQSPGWGDLGFNRKKKKKGKSPTTPKPAEEKKTKKRSRLSKLAPRRPVQSATSPVPPLPLVPKPVVPALGLGQAQQGKPGLATPSGILKTTDLLVKSSLITNTSSDNYTTTTIQPSTAATTILPQPPLLVSHAQYEQQDRGFVGGIRLEREAEAASQALTHSRVRSRSGSLSLFPNARPAINSQQQRSHSSRPGIEGQQQSVNQAAQIPRSITLTDVSSARNHGIIAENKQTCGHVVTQDDNFSDRSTLSTGSRTSKFPKPRQAKSEHEPVIPDPSSSVQVSSDSGVSIGSHHIAQNFEFPKAASMAANSRQQLRKQPPLYALPNDTFSPHQGKLQWQQQSSISGPVGANSSFATAMDRCSIYAHLEGQDDYREVSQSTKGLSPPPRQAYVKSLHSGSSFLGNNQPSLTQAEYLSHQGPSELPPNGGTARSFREKAMALLRSPTLENAPVIAGPFYPRGSGPSFPDADSEPNVSSSIEQLVAMPSRRTGQASGGSSTSSFDDVYMTSPNTTPESSRPQSAKETPAVVGEVTNGTGRGKIIVNDSRTNRYSQQASLIMVKQPSVRSQLRRSSSTYSQVDSPFHLEASAKYEFSNGKPVLSTPQADRKEQSLVIDFSELVATGDQVEGTQTPAALAKANAQDEQQDIRVWHNMASSIDSGDSEPSDLSRATSQEESDGFFTGVDVSFLPPLKHEPFIPPKSRARKSRMLRRSEDTDDDEVTVPRIAIAVEHSQLATGAAYLREARKSVLMPPSVISMPQSKPPKMPAKLSLAPPISMVVPKAPPTSKPILANSSANRLSTQTVTSPPVSSAPEKSAATGVTVSRRSLLPPPAPSSTANAVAIKKVAPPGLLGQKVAKMLVECCNCRFLHDMPSRVYECMVSPDAVVEDHTIGISGAITTMVKCPWCTHNMSTSCCAGYATVIHLTERMH